MALSAMARTRGGGSLSGLAGRVLRPSLYASSLLASAQGILAARSVPPQVSSQFLKYACRYTLYS